MAMHALCEREGQVSTITMTSADRRQILDRASYEGLAHALAAADGDSETRVVVLRGLAGCFCLGGDLAEFLDSDRHRGLIAAVKTLFQQLATQKKPLLAMVDGDAVGVGCTILFHCDLVFASSRSTFRVPFVDFGLVPDAATSILAPERMGYARAFRFFCLGETLDAWAAERAGLVAEVSAAEDLGAACTAVARRLVKKPGEALVNTRGLLRADARTLCDRVDREISLFRDALADDTTIRRLRRLARAA